MLVFDVVQNANQLLLLVLIETCWELNIEFEDQIAAAIVFLDGTQWIIIQNGHSFAWYDFEGFWTDDLVDTDLNLLVLDCFEVDGARAEGVDEGDLVLENEVMANALEYLVCRLFELDDQVCGSAARQLVAFCGKDQFVSTESTRLDLNDFGHLCGSWGASIVHERCLFEFNRLLAAVIEFLKSALNLNSQLFLLCRQHIDRLLRLESPNRSAMLIKGHCIRIGGPKELLKNFE